MTMICYNTGSDCYRWMRVASIAIGITALGISIAGAGMPIVFLLNNLASFLVGKLGKLICDKGITQVFRDVFLTPGHQLLKDIGKDIEEMRDTYHLGLYETAVAALVVSPFIILWQILKLVGKFIMKLAFGMTQLVKKLTNVPKILKAAKETWDKAGAMDQELKDISDTAEICCGVKGDLTTVEALEEEANDVGGAELEELKTLSENDIDLTSQLLQLGHDLSRDSQAAANEALTLITQAAKSDAVGNIVKSVTDAVTNAVGAGAAAVEPVGQFVQGICQGLSCITRA